MKRSLTLIFSTFICLAGCRTAHLTDSSKITSINIIDRNGLSETISSKDRLNTFDQTDFLAPQPYQKVMRVYGREKNGDTHSCVTSYHPNGLIKQYLEAVNNRAFGKYREWYANGQLKVEANVIGGPADLNTQAEENWIFDGCSRAWNEEGTVVAEIYYNKGELEGESVYYHPNGQVWKINPCQKNQLHGNQKIFLDNGDLLITTQYVNGVKEGISLRYWTPAQIAYHEIYEKGQLKTATYFNEQGDEISKIEDGTGLRAIFGKHDLQELQEFRNGVQEGTVKVFDEKQMLVRTYQIRNGDKHGEEIDYFPNSSQPKLLTTWNEGALEGPVKTWYENGTLESQREMSANKKNGLLTAWYRNGALMLVEEYDNDRLVKGEYYRLGEKIPLSKIEKGKGISTLFNPDGNFSRKIYYQEGKPIE